MVTGHPLEKIINGPAHHTLHHLYFTVNYGQVSRDAKKPYTISIDTNYPFPGSTLLGRTELVARIGNQIHLWIHFWTSRTSKGHS